MDIFESLSRDPFIPGDSARKDRVGRDCQEKQFGVWLVTYWADHYVNRIHIIAVEKLQPI